MDYLGYNTIDRKK